MTEIPEHLLQRSKAARAKASGGGDAGDGGEDAGSDSGASAAPAAASAPVPAQAAATPAPVEEKPPPPPPPYVEAYQKRRKIPMWAMPVVAALPLWAYLFQGTLEPAPSGEGDPIEVGGEIYAARCAQCHGGAGGGGVGPAFVDGAIYATFPDIETHFDWVRLGSEGWTAERGSTYGANAKPVAGGMPGFPDSALSDVDLLYVIAYERAELGGANPDEAAAARLEAALAYAAEHPDATLAEILEQADLAAE